MTEELEKLRKKFFPRVPWDEALGPVRRRYFVRAASGDALAAVAALGEREGFTEPGQRTVTGDGAACLAAFREKAAGGPVGMILGTETGAFWCDIALGGADGEGWRPMIVRSEEGENLTALAHGAGTLYFRRWEE